MTPIMTKQEMFCQIWCEYEPTFEAFKAHAAPKVETAKHNNPSPMLEHGEDFLCASCVPWLHFTSLTQADYAFSQTIPVLAWGKLKNNIIPVSCRFNHSFMDGLHVSRFFNNIEERFTGKHDLNSPTD
jgi:chloramphenicol O-acetyltransferase type A